MQLAKALRAPTSRRSATRRTVELVRSLGADEVVDYTQEDFTKNGETYDVVFDAVGKHSFRRCRGSLKPGGIFLETDLGFMWHVPPLALLDPVDRRQEGDARDPQVHEGRTSSSSRSSSRRGSTARSSTGRTRSRTSSRRRSYVETGQKTGNVVLTVSRNGTGARADESGRPRPVRAAGGAPRSTRSSDPVPKDDEVLVRVHATTVTQTDCHMRCGEPVHLALHARAAPTEAEDPRPRVRRRGRGSRLGGHRVRGRRPRLRPAERRARGVRLRARDRPARAHARPA